MRRCPHCSNPVEMCSDSEREWFPVRDVCYASMVESAARADYKELHEDKPWHDGSFASWAKERDARHPFHFEDGVTITVAAHDPTPDDDFLNREVVGHGDEA